MIPRKHPLSYRLLAACTLALVLVSCSRESAPEPSAPATSAPPTLRGAYGVYVTNEVSGDLTVIDPANHSVVATLPLGKRPRGIRSSADGTVLYVALSGSPIAPPGVDESTLPPPDPGSNGIGVIDVRTLTLRTILRGPTDPEQTSLNADGTRLFIANEDRGVATVMEIASGKTVAEIEVGGEPEGVTTSTDGRVVYVTSEEENQVSAIDTATLKVVRQFEVGARPRDSAFSPDSSRAYVTGENSGTVSVVDTKTHTVIETVKLTGQSVRPMGVVVSPDGQRVYVSTGRGATIVVLDAATLKPVGSVAVGTRPWGIALSPDGSRLYTANGPSNDVSVVDTASMTVVATVPAGQSPWGVAVVPR